MEVRYILDRIYIVYRIGTCVLAKLALGFFYSCWKQKCRDHDKASGLRTGLEPPSTPTQGGECTMSLPLTTGLQQPLRKKSNTQS
uniref:Protein kinase DC2-like n=1 Tax=Drosophila rhopaloa TaxID=1041015 RepID=A0A6P4ELH9_DRORH